MTDKVNLLVDHYQKTYEVTYEFWKQRNNTFVYLLLVMGLGTLLVFGGPNTNSLLVYWIAKWLSVPDAQVGAIQASFPFGLIQLVVLAAVFYFMVNLYHRTESVLRNYQYLGKLEDEIRVQLGLDRSSVAFTREGVFYGDHHPRTLGLVAVFYVILLGLLFFAFLGGRIYFDVLSKDTLRVAVDVIMIIAIGTFYIAYSRSSLGLDRGPKAAQRSKVESDRPVAGTPI